MKYKLLINLVDRANYGRLFPLILEGYQDERFEIYTCFSGTTLLEEYGIIVDKVSIDGIKVDYKVNTEVKSRNHSAMLDTISNTINKMKKLYEKVNPDAILLIGDRYEALGCAIAASYANRFLVHIQGGEQSSSIDETTRHLITKMAHFHFPSTDKAAKIINLLGEYKENIVNSGCPVGDYILSNNSNLDSLQEIIDENNKKISLDILKKGYLLICVHPITTGIEDSKILIKNLLKVLENYQGTILWIRPNADPGSNEILDSNREIKHIRFITNIMPRDFQSLLKNSQVALGNSSSFVRDSSFSGTPVVLIGERQKNREVSKNVILVNSFDYESIKDAFDVQLKKGKYPSSRIYGNGKASKIILDSIANKLTNKINLQKQLSYKI
ncbi:UDP-N-acetylglucosamine 2-epimerase [Prochlorococcus marinus]|uniref:UDP-N-acetylglucosamine 2-epimerase n=1 Tax=Prochlorococcus marinus TaxID=1219 RepID=UPI001ADBF0D1|nr:UDP-N-acetylglucosamine 2-epimerase [Prochlorococcus marinus]MBO8217684.1 UDP-N-acetylglucosamine 2-epimerase (hydrolyzing) [Prochlorococcus marinus XMU1405]MBW3040847.1 UDP-N-acetylglucosamine 2-epimerase (hydrolyzing) [Prochlorococcus marinus str. MU1405]MBW3048306.1 UDP-N-acetylglucosamine 2-epimerase (hydrolyzing) [Prochlorococcus marinus str. MU1406]